MNNQSEQTLYNEWQSNPKFHTEESQLTDGIYYDGLIHQLEEENHQLLSNLTPYSSSPLEEPWIYGPPSFTYYTQIDLPILQLGYNLQFGPYQSNDTIKGDTLFIPCNGKCEHSILKQYIGHIIGPQGDHLKYITETTGLHYIWYNENPKNEPTLPPWGCFQLWGCPEKLPYAKALLNTHIQSITKQFKIK